MTDTKKPTPTVPDQAHPTASEVETERRRQVAEDTRTSAQAAKQNRATEDLRTAKEQQLIRRPGESDADWTKRQQDERVYVDAAAPGYGQRSPSRALEFLDGLAQQITDVAGDRDKSLELALKVKASAAELGPDLLGGSDDRYYNRDVDGRLPVTYGDAPLERRLDESDADWAVRQRTAPIITLERRVGESDADWAARQQADRLYADGQRVRDRAARTARRHPVYDPRDREIVHQLDGRTTLLALELGHDAASLEQLRNQMQLDARDSRVATPAQFDVITVAVARLRAFAAQLTALCASLDVPLPQVPTLPAAPSVPPQRS
jgi:hypothetical protein